MGERETSAWIEGLQADVEQGKRVFQMMFDHMPTVVLHPQFVDEVKNHPDLNTTEAIKKVCP